MGWGRTLLLGDIGTQLNVGDVERDLEQVRAYLRSEHAEHDSLEAAVYQLQAENRDLKMYMATLIRMLVDKQLLSQDELKRFVDLLDPPGRRS